jgi:F-type H+-transporting ATPase subunit b
MKNRLLLGPISSQSTAPPAVTSAKKEAVVEEVAEESKYEDGLLYRPPPVPVIEKVNVNSVQELQTTQEPLEDQLRVWFGKDMPTINDDKKPDRDVANFPRFNPATVVPEKYRMAFIPNPWFTFFYNKTGVTGPYMFGASFLTFMFSKEYLVFEHEMLAGVMFIIVGYGVVTKFKDGFNKYMEGAIDSEVNEWKGWQQGSIKTLEDYIGLEKKNQESLKEQKILFDAKRENIHLQREAEFRKRQMTVYQEIKRKLDYQIASQMARKQFAQRHMVSWIIENVQKGISPQQEKEALTKCIADLKALSGTVSI